MPNRATQSGVRIFRYQAKGFLKKAGQYLIISRRVINPFTLRDLEPAVHPRNHSLISFVVNQPNVSVRFRESLNNFDAFIRGRIIDDDNFERLD